MKLIWKPTQDYYAIEGAPMILSCENIQKNKTVERYILPKYDSAFTKFLHVTHLIEEYFHYCDLIKLDMLKYDPKYSDSQNLCFEKLIFKIQEKIIYNNQDKTICISSDEWKSDGKSKAKQ